jgi:tetratricopeptide (TPR) repeat protein
VGRPGGPSRSGDRSRPDSASGNRPWRGRPDRADGDARGSRPRAYRPAGDRVGAGRPGADRSGGGRSGADRPGGGRPGDGRPGGGRRPERADSDRNDRGRSTEAAAPRIPDNITEEQLSRDARAELRGLPQDLATTVGRYLVAAELAKDPELAYRYAQAARKLAARIGVVREVSGTTAYRSGRWAEALAELRAARRMTGRGEYLPLMADSERALGRLDRALDLVHSDEARRLPRPARIELRIVESGIRRDQGLVDAAVLALQVPEISDGRLRPWSTRLFYAYGDALLAAGRREEARDAFARAVAADENEETDALERLEQLDGVTVNDLEEADEDEDEDEEDDFGEDEDLGDLEDDDEYDLDEDDEDADFGEDEGEDEDEDNLQDIAKTEKVMQNPSAELPVIRGMSDN